MQTDLDDLVAGSALGAHVHAVLAGVVEVELLNQDGQGGLSGLTNLLIHTLGLEAEKSNC